MAEKGCPRCGYQPHGDQAPSRTTEDSATSPQPPIQFDVVVSSEPGKSSEGLDWRAELKRRLDERADKPEDEDLEPVIEVLEEELENEEEESDELPTKLFKYKLDKALRQSSPAAGTSSSKPKTAPPLFEKPLVRQKPVRPLSQDPDQRSLRLKPAGPVVERIESKEAIEQATLEEPRISKEVILSRFLSGIVDLFFPVFLGTAFTVVASLFLDLDLFYAGSVRWIALLAFCFFIFNSLFFFMTSGQTLGMMATDLHLVSENEDEEVTTTSVLLRVLFFIPSVLTVIGLAWAIYDPLCRCLHDLVSRTRIIPGR